MKSLAGLEDSLRADVLFCRIPFPLPGFSGAQLLKIPRGYWEAVYVQGESKNKDATCKENETTAVAVEEQKQKKPDPNQYCNRPNRLFTIHNS
jgi:hypothetical protein